MFNSDLIRFGRAAAILCCAFAFSFAASAQDAPKYKYDSSWPKLPLPNKWTFENVSGMYVDKDDHVWVLQRPSDFDADPTENYASLNPPSAECCVRPPAVLEF